MARESHYLDRRPVSPIDRVRHDLEGSSRFRNDYDGVRFEQNQREEFVRVHSDRQVSDRSSRDYEIVSKGFELKSSSSDDRYELPFEREIVSREMADGMTGNVRWSQDRKTARHPNPRDEFVVIGNNDFGNRDRDEPRVFSRKHDYHDAEVERYSDRGSREGSLEFNRTPKKQVQKKSAFLRIQMAKPNHRGREDERPHHASHSSELKSGSFRGKDQVVHSDDGMEEKRREQREGSMVDLDVSFKSNSLVAKAVVPPPSSAAAALETSLTPRNSKISKVAASDKDSSSPKPTKVNEGSLKVHDSTRDGNNSRSSGALKRSEAKGASGVGNTQGSVTKSRSNLTPVSLGKDKVKRSPKVDVKLEGSSNVASSSSALDKDPKQSEVKAKSSDVSLGKDKVKRSPKVDVNLDGKSNVASSSPALEKGPKQSEPKAKSSSKSNLRESDIPSSGGNDVSLLDKKVDAPHKSLTSGTDGGNKFKIAPFKVVKKKKVVKKLPTRKTDVPARGLPAASVSNKGLSPLKRKELPDVESLGPGVNPLSCSASAKGVSLLKKQLPPANSVHGADPEDCPKRANACPDIPRKDGVLKGRSKEEVSTSVIPNEASALKANRKRKSLSPPLSCSGQKEAKVGANYLNAKTPRREPLTAQNVVESIKSLKDTISGAAIIVDISQNSGQNGSINSSGLLRSEENTVNEGVMDTKSATNALSRSTNLDNCITDSQELMTDSDAGALDAGKTHSCADLTSPFVKGGNAEAFDNSIADSIDLIASDACALDAGNVHDCANLSSPFVKSGITEGSQAVNFSAEPLPSCLDESRIQVGRVDVGPLDHIGGSISNPGSGYTDLGESKQDKGDGFSKLLSPQGITLSHENGGTEGSPDALPSVFREEDIPNVLNKSESEIVESNISSSVCTSTAMVSADLVSSAQCGDTTLSSVRNSSPPNADVSCVENNLEQHVNEISVANKSGSRDTFSEPKVSNIDVSLEGSSEDNIKHNFSSYFSVKESVTKETIAGIEMSLPDAQLPSNSDDQPSHSREEPTISSRDGLLYAGLPPPKSTVLPNNLEDESSPAVGLVGDICLDDNVPVDCTRVDSSSVFLESALSNPSPLCPPPGSGCDRLSTETPVSAVDSDQMDIDDYNEENTGVESAQEQTMTCHEASLFRSPEPTEFDQRLQSADAENSGSYPFDREELPFLTNSSVFVDNVSRSPGTTSGRGPIPVQGLPSVLGSTEICNPSNIHPLTCKESQGELVKNIGVTDEYDSDDYYIEGASSYPWTSKNNVNSADAMNTDHSGIGKPGVLPSHDSKIKTNVQNPVREAHGSKYPLNNAVPRNYPSRSQFVIAASKNVVSSAARTWHRPGNSASLPIKKTSLSTIPPQKQIAKKVTRPPSTSYVRKGNSLVRKAAPPHSLNSSVYRLNASIVDETKKSTGAGKSVDVVDSSNLMQTGGSAPFERPRTPPLPTLTKVLNHSVESLRDDSSSSLMEHPSVDYCEPRDLTSPMEIDDVLNLSEDGLKNSETLNENSSVDNLDSQTEQNEESLVSSSLKRVTYVKPKSNQLVATSDQCNSSIYNAGKNHTAASLYDGYYKRSKNQLIRTAAEGQNNQSVRIPGDKSNSVRNAASGAISGRAFSKKQFRKAKNYKPSKFSLVWTLSNNSGDSLRRPKILPQLLPWKRVSYWRNIMLNSASCHSSSLSPISRKLLLSRKRNTVYTRSSNGFSLRKSKVLSVGCSSLKWSKTIETQSKKANEEATLAVAAAERKKREQTGSVRTFSTTANKKNLPHKTIRGKRIYRVGSVRYKMDSSRRTLQRISDDESSCPADFPSENNLKKPIVPKRLIIGNEEYVRIGNGNQLVRNPKKRTRILASEKVRWSLHTARLKLSKKRKYCQFFTRFGKCNKDNGKCPYIHDSSKIAVCTKYLKGQCLNPDCKLTHQVIPERMPDCSYYLQGLCTNESCPYRHVHVNPYASTCEGFLKGYCADGDECRKKHSYVCPAFEATGSCPQGSKCKLHHPKKRSRGKKKKQAREQKKSQGRYFGSLQVDSSESGRAVGERQARVDNLSADQFSDYISLGDSDEEASESFLGAMNEVVSSRDDDFWDSGVVDDLDALIKPVAIMNRSRTTLSL